MSFSMSFDGMRFCANLVSMHSLLKDKDRLQHLHILSNSLRRSSYFHSFSDLFILAVAYIFSHDEVNLILGLLISLSLAFFVPRLAFY